MKECLRWAENYIAMVNGTTSATKMIGGTDLVLLQLARAIVADCKPAPKESV